MSQASLTKRATPDLYAPGAPAYPVLWWVGVDPFGSSRSNPSGVCSLPGAVPGLPVTPYCHTSPLSDPAGPGQLQLSPFRSFGFDSAVIVLLSATDYAVLRASKVPRSVVESSAIYRKHVNGKVLFARPEIMGHPDASDLTVTFRATQTGRKTP